MKGVHVTRGGLCAPAEGPLPPGPPPPLRGQEGGELRRLSAQRHRFRPRKQPLSRSWGRGRPPSRGTSEKAAGGEGSRRTATGIHPAGSFPLIHHPRSISINQSTIPRILPPQRESGPEPNWPRPARRPSIHRRAVTPTSAPRRARPGARGRRTARSSSGTHPPIRGPWRRTRRRPARCRAGSAPRRERRGRWWGSAG